MMKKILVLLFVITLVLVAYNQYRRARINWRIEGCLDFNGSFNYETCKCDFEESHPYKENHQCK